MRTKDFLAVSSSLQIYDNTKAVLGICRRILEYDDIYLKADTGNVVVEIWGNDLLINECGEEGIEVTGKIKSVEFSEASGRRERKF